jgi:hypothetical protein
VDNILIKDFNQNDFTLKLDFKNLTSDTSVAQKIYLSTVANAGCTVILPLASCSQGHKVRLRISVIHNIKQTKNPPKETEIIGKVLELNAIGDKYCEINISFSQYLHDEWFALLKLFELKQERISEILSTLKSLESKDA